MGPDPLVFLVLVAILPINADIYTRQVSGSKPVELVGGNVPWEGRIFVRAPGGQYGGLCSSYVTTADLTTVCKTLYPHETVKGVSSPVSTFGGSYENRVLSSSPGCLGTETNILDCPKMGSSWIDRSICVRGEAAVHCEANTQVRLAGGSQPYMGRLEVYTNKTWGTVCNKGFDAKDARVICDKLGYWNTHATVQSATAYGKTTAPIKMENLTCTGNETDIAFCSWSPANCNRTDDVGINCQQISLPSTYVKLTDGVNPWRGRLEVMENNFRQKWSSLCGVGFTAANAKVACTSLGFKLAGTVLAAMPPVSTAPVYLNRLVCKGTETNLGLCPGFFSQNSFDCSGAYPPVTAAIDCSGGIQARLVGGKNPLEGRPEIFVNGKWSAVYSSAMGVSQANAVCATLGYQATRAQVLAPNAFGKSTTLSVIQSLTCSAALIHLAQCTVGTSSTNKALNQAAIRCFSCGSTYTTESGDLYSPGYPGSANESTDCLYHIAPSGTAMLYKLSISNYLLGYNDRIEIKESPLAVPVKVYTHSTGFPGIHLFKKDAYIRFKTSCCGPRHFRMHWEPVTIESTVRLVCNDVGMDIRVNLTELSWLYPDTNPAYISLINEGCTGSHLGDTWHINNPHADCFTNRMIDNTRVTYQNALIYKEIGSGPIVREHRWRVDLKCEFTRNVVVNQAYTVSNKFNYQDNMTSVYTAEMHMYNDSTLAHEMSFAPIRARLGDDLYIKVDLKGNWNVSMRLQNCIGKPAPNSTITYALIHNGGKGFPELFLDIQRIFPNKETRTTFTFNLTGFGTQFSTLATGPTIQLEVCQKYMCATDSETHVVYEDRSTTLFHFKAFEFYAGFSTVYLSCDVIFCAPRDSSSQCNWKCNTATRRRSISLT